MFHAFAPSTANVYPIQHDSTNYQQVGDWARKALSFDAASFLSDQNTLNKNDENELCGQKSNMEDTLNYYFIWSFFLFHLEYSHNKKPENAQNNDGWV